MTNRVHLRIKVHFFVCIWEMKGHWSRVNLLALLKYLTATSVLSFPKCKQKKCTSILISMQKRWKTPKKSKKSMSIFPSRDQWHWKIFATVFLCFIASECHRSLNIKTCKHVKLFYTKERNAEGYNLIK